MPQAKRRTGKSLDDTEVSGGGGQRKQPKDVVDLLELPGGKWVTVRLHGEVFAYGGYWVTTKKRDGNKAQFYTPAINFDPETGRVDATKPDPWGDHDGPEVRYVTDFYSNALVRALQKKIPQDLPDPTETEVDSGFKEKGSETWTPNRVLRMSTSIMRGLKDLKELNVHEDENGRSQAYGVSHPKYGCDVMIKHNPEAAPANRYQVQKGEHKPLKKSERAFLTYDLSELQELPALEEQKKEYQKWAERMGLVKAKKKGEEDDEDEAPAKGKKRVLDDEDDEDEAPAPKKGAKKVVDDDDDDEDDVPAKKPVKKAAKKAVDEDEDEDEDEDDVPVKKAAPKKAVKKPAKDEDDDDEDDEEDEAPVKKGAKKPVKKVVDDDDDDDDEDDVPAKKPVKKKGPPKIEDDDLDDEEDEAPAAKKGAKKPVKKVVDDDDDDDDEVPAKKTPAKKTAKKAVDFDDEEDD